MKLDIYKSKNSGKEYYLIKFLRGPYAYFRPVGTADRPLPLLRRDMDFVKSVNV